MENQVRQITKQLIERPPGTFTINTEPNPKEHCKVITLRSGKTLEVHRKSEEAENSQVDSAVEVEDPSFEVSNDSQEQVKKQSNEPFKGKKKDTEYDKPIEVSL